MRGTKKRSEKGGQTPFALEINLRESDRKIEIGIEKFLAKKCKKTWCHLLS
jgi:hypothetical protein